MFGGKSLHQFTGEKPTDINLRTAYKSGWEKFYTLSFELPSPIGDGNVSYDKPVYTDFDCFTPTWVGSCREGYYPEASVLKKVSSLQITLVRLNPSSN